MSGVNSQDLKGALSRLAQMQPRVASAAAEHRVLEAFRKRRKRRPAVWVCSATAAACLALGIGWFWARRPAPVQTTSAANESYYTTPPGFVALPYAQSGVPLEQAVIVRVQIHAGELRMLGMAAPAARAGERMSADLLVGQDGIARAVRLIE
jgi:hypothetical protein